MVKLHNKVNEKIVSLPFQVVKLLRPVHWVKNLAIFAALIFSGNLYSKPLFVNVLFAFVCFSLATSATYIFNDILDVNHDRLHPIKRFRPIASGAISAVQGVIIMVVLLTLSLYLSSGFNKFFFLSVVAYIIIQIFYSLKLKNIPIIDILIIASGFIIRVYAGAFIIDSHLSVWFLLCVISAALFLASGKRRAELGVIAQTLTTTRTSLAKYSKPLLDSYVTMFGNAAWLSWALFTFFESPSAARPVWLFLAELSRTTTVSKLLMITIPLAIFGIMRYEQLIFENKSEAPEKLFLTDIPLVTSLFLWVTLVVWILYGGVASWS